MVSAFFTCLATVVTLVGSVLLFFYVVLPVIGHIFKFFGRVVRFIFQECNDVILLPIALFVCVVKLLRAAICVILARWDIVHTELAAAKRRGNESWDRIMAIFIENPLRMFAIEPPKKTPSFKPHSGTQNIAFEGYTIVGTLPSGGSGAKLYVAKSKKTNTHVVIKNFDITSGSQLPQIVRESRAMEAAKKLGLVIEHQLNEERFWYAMPYHDGDHLGAVTNKIHHNKSKLSESQLQTILSYQLTLLHTLKEYHTAGLWHKDVKPDNIIINGGHAYLVDLGLVTPLGSAMTLTTHGTEYFRDPELVRRAMRGVKVHQVDGSKFDVFGAGAVLYFMLENTFPAHGGLSDFSKESPECVRWIVRRAMADYDKRYNSIDEMLTDVSTVLGADKVSDVRPADLPSMGAEPPKHTVRRTPPRSTPSTGGGPFVKQKYRTRPFGLIALLLTVVVGVSILTQYENRAQEQISAIELTPPSGRVLVLNELSTTANIQAKKTASNKVTSLGVSGWDFFTDQDKEASVRSWLPTDPLVEKFPTNKLSEENISGILLIKEGTEDNPSFYFIDNNGPVLIQ
jgi:serine/threonine protein kinase